MTMEDVMKLVMGVIVLLVVVFIFNKMFSIPECNSMANDTAYQLASTIETVEKGECFLVDNPRIRCPCNDPETCYAATQLKLCQQSIVFNDASFTIPFTSTTFDLSVANPILQTFGSAITGSMPAYQLYYEQPPGYDAGDWDFWDETYPWSGGGANALIFYGAIKAGTGIIGKIPKATKAAGEATSFGDFLKRQRVKFVYSNRFTRWLSESGVDKVAAKKRAFASLAMNAGGTLTDDIKKIESKVGSIDYYADKLKKGDSIQSVADEIKTDLDFVGETKNSAKRAKKLAKFLAKTNKYTTVFGATLSESLSYVDGELKALDGWIEVTKGADGASFARDYKGRYVIDNQFRKDFRNLMKRLPAESADQYRSMFYAPYRNVPTTWRYRAWKRVSNSWLMDNKIYKGYKNAQNTLRMLNVGEGKTGKNILTKTQAREFLVDTKWMCLKDKEKCMALLKLGKDNEAFAAQSGSIANRIRKGLGREVKIKYAAFTEANLYAMLDDMENTLKANNYMVILPDNMDLSKYNKLDELSPFEKRIMFAPIDQQLDDLKFRHPSTYLDEYKATSIEELYKFDDELIESGAGGSFLDIGRLSDDIGSAQTLDEVNGVLSGSGVFPDEVANVLDNSLKEGLETRRAAMLFSEYNVMNKKGFQERIMVKPLYKSLVTEGYFTNMNTKSLERFRFFDILGGGAKPISWSEKAAQNWHQLTHGAYSSYWRTRIRKTLTVDIAKIYNPFNPLGGSYTTRKIQQEMPTRDGSLLLSTSGTESLVIPLNTSKNIKLYRPKEIGGRTGLFIQTWWMSATAPPKNPRFYVVSPCMGIAKVWKDGDTIFVKPEPCDANKDGDKCSNYCFANDTYIWGEDSVDSDINLIYGTSVAAGWAAYGGVMAGCIAGSFGTGTGACPEPASWAGKAAALATLTTEYYALSPLSPDWGYWDYFKVSDACDNIDVMFSMAGWSGWAKMSGKGISMLGKGSKFAKVANVLPDFCMIYYVQGEQYLAWPGRGSTKIETDDESITAATPDCIAGVNQE